MLHHSIKKETKKSNTDKYRAVAVSSVKGKLFATIVLDRLNNYRNCFCPDSPNQLGFTKNAQKYANISKYKKKPVYAVFVDILLSLQTDPVLLFEQI